jgi:predicted transcriptional regulator
MNYLNIRTQTLLNVDTAVRQEGGDDEVLWRLARALYELAKASSDAHRAAALLREAYDNVTAALAINDRNFAVHKWTAILVDEVAALEGSKARILQSFVMKDHMQVREIKRVCALSLYNFYCVALV